MGEVNSLIYESQEGGFYNLNLCVFLNKGETLYLTKVKRTETTIVKPQWWELWRRETVLVEEIPIDITEQDVSELTITKVKV